MDRNDRNHPSKQGCPIQQTVTGDRLALTHNGARHGIQPVQTPGTSRRRSMCRHPLNQHLRLGPLSLLRIARPPNYLVPASLGGSHREWRLRRMIYTPIMQKFSVLLLLAATLRAQPPAQAQIREAATRAVALIQATQKAWPAKQSCTSCHHQLQPSIAFRTARDHGIQLDEQISATTDLATYDFKNALDFVIQSNFVGETAMADAYRLIAAHEAGVKPNLGTAITARVIAARQRSEGDWTSFHSRPPASYSRFSMTAIALRSIQLYGHPSQQAEMKARIGRASTWLAANKPHDTEGRTFQLLGLHWAGANKTLIEKCALALKETQQADGGWGMLEGRTSEAYSTSEALIALLDSGHLRPTDKAYQRGLVFLLKTQAPDGSWHVPTRLESLPVSPPYFETGYPYGHDQFISVQGACWAIMALSRALPRRMEVQPRILNGVEPQDVEPWIEKVMFGSVAELRQLLNSGFDANSATRAGGTTALMIAAPNIEKLQLLLDRGAKVNARAKSKYSALMVATQFTEATPAIRILLGRGAEVRLPKEQGAPMFNAHPFLLAAYAGNIEALPLLKAAGDRIDDTMNLFGTFPVSPLTGAVVLGDLPVVRALLTLGAPVNREAGGATPLSTAILGHHIEIARLLIENGADVNQLDKNAATPLFLAAATDFGDTAMVDLLLNAGARRDARNKEGLTPAEVARKLKRTYLTAKLQ